MKKSKRLFLWYETWASFRSTLLWQHWTRWQRRSSKCKWTNGICSESLTTSLKSRLKSKANYSNANLFILGWCNWLLTRMTRNQLISTSSWSRWFCRSKMIIRRTKWRGYLKLSASSWRRVSCRRQKCSIFITWWMYIYKRPLRAFKKSPPSLKRLLWRSSLGPRTLSILKSMRSRLSIW